MIVDYHVHTPFCGHAHGKMAEYVETAINAGVAELGFSDHLGRYYLGRLQRKRYWDWGMPEKDLERYVAEVMELKQLYADKISIKVGLEVDYIEGAEHLAQCIISKFPFDFILGSIHCLPALGWYHLTHYTKAVPENVYTWYFAAARAALASGLFQSIAHLDFVWRYIPWPEQRRVELITHISDTVAVAVASGVAIEINANGYLWSQANFTRNFDPFDLMLDVIKEKNATITLGSDAHAPKLVAKFFPEIIRILNKKGISLASIFSKKKQSSVPLV
ncbi:MAG TPA: histidinol-phosphatase [Chitinivibrionales bacterium]